jgi:hypothetical protein
LNGSTPSPPDSPSQAAARHAAIGGQALLVARPHDGGEARARVQREGLGHVHLEHERPAGHLWPDVDALGAGLLVVGDHLLVVRIALHREQRRPRHGPPHQPLELEDVAVVQDAPREQRHHPPTGVAHRLEQDAKLGEIGDARRDRPAAVAVVRGRGTGGEPHGAAGHGIGHHGGHGLELAVGGGTLVGVLAHHVQPHGGVADVAGVVQRRPSTLHGVEVLRERLELVPRHPHREGVEAHVLDVLEGARHERDERTAHRGDGEAAVAGDDRRHPVVRGGGEVGIPEHLGVVVGVDVDEAGRHHLAAGVELLVPPQALAHRHDAPALDGDVGPAAGRPGAVHHRATPDHERCVHVRPPPPRRRPWPRTVSPGRAYGRGRTGYVTSVTDPAPHGDAIDLLDYEDRAVSELLAASSDAALDRSQHGEVVKLLVEHLAVRQVAREELADVVAGVPALAALERRMRAGVPERRAELRELDELTRGVEPINVNQGQDTDAVVARLRPALEEEIRYDLEELVPALRRQLSDRQRAQLPTARYIRRHAPTHPGPHRRRWYDRVGPLLRLHAVYDYLRGFPTGGLKPSAEVEAARAASDPARRQG